MFSAWKITGIVGLVSAVAMAILFALWQGEKAGRAKDREAWALATAAAANDAAALQKKLDQASIDFAAKDAIVQEVIVEKTRTIVKEVPRYVKDDSTCITLGLIRVLDAAALGADPETLTLSPGEFDEACAGLGSHALATSVAENYGRARQNAQQLTDLQDWVSATAKELEP